MRRRLDEDGEAVLAAWLDHYQPDKETRHLITEALDAYAGDTRQVRFYSEADISNPGVTVIEPAEKLTVHVRLRGAGQFTLVRIIDERTWDED
jgi:alkylhydroperoxidase/carboxymuconolactone decarboxylase family protein YurZ